MTTQLNSLGDTVFEMHRIAGREWYIVEAAHTNGMMFYVRPAQWEDGEVAGALQFLAQCREEIEAMKVCATDNVWFTTRTDKDDECECNDDIEPTPRIVAWIDGVLYAVKPIMHVRHIKGN